MHFQAGYKCTLKVHIIFAILFDVVILCVIVVGPLELDWIVVQLVSVKITDLGRTDDVSV